jgi:hypothetical protein
VIKTVGYLISSLSVLLLGLVAWDGAKDKPVLLACLVLGMLSSVVGMFCRWLSYQEKEEPPRLPAAAQQKSATGRKA